MLKLPNNYTYEVVGAASPIHQLIYCLVTVDFPHFTTLAIFLLLKQFVTPFRRASLYCF